MEIQGYCDKETQYRNTSTIHHASDLAFESIDLDVEPRLHQFNFKNNGHITKVGVDLGVWYSIH
jgi:hypothetical protein